MTEEERAETAVVLGNTGSNIESSHAFFRTGAELGARAVNPADFPATLLNYPAAQVSHAFELLGANATISSGISSSVDAVGYGAELISLGRERFVIAGGVEQLPDLNVGEEHDSLEVAHSELLSPRVGFGTEPSEGLGALLLASEQEAKGRSLAQIRGYRSATGAEPSTLDEVRDRAVATLRGVVQSSGLTIADIDVVFPSMSGVAVRDALEISVLRRTFGGRLPALPIVLIKPVAGECHTASGVLQCIAAVYAIQNDDWRAQRLSYGNGEPVLVESNGTTRAENALVYSMGADKSFSALVLSTPQHQTAHTAS